MSTVERVAGEVPATTQEPGRPDRPGRVAGLTAGVRSLASSRRRERAGSWVPPVDRLLAMAGATALPLGGVAIFLGWYGAAHTPLLFEQIPYLISGGLLGVALVIGGGLLFFGAWLARLAEQDRQDARELIEAIHGLREAVLAGMAAGTAAGTGLVATRSGSMAHRPDCPVVASRDASELVAVTGEGHRPCKICDPDLG